MATFVGLASPHVEHGIATSLLEAVHHSGVVLEVSVQGGPVSRKRIPMLVNFPPSREPQGGWLLNYAIHPLSSGLVLMTKVGVMDAVTEMLSPSVSPRPVSRSRAKRELFAATLLGPKKCSALGPKKCSARRGRSGDATWSNTEGLIGLRAAGATAHGQLRSGRAMAMRRARAALPMLLRLRSLQAERALLRAALPFAPSPNLSCAAHRGRRRGAGFCSLRSCRGSTR